MLASRLRASPTLTLNTRRPNRARVAANYHASLPQLGHRGQRVSDLRDTAQISATGHSTPCAGRRHDSCQCNEAEWNEFDALDADEKDTILDLQGSARSLADETS